MSPAPWDGTTSRNIRLVLGGQAITLLGDYVALLALPLFVLEVTGSSLDLGLTTAFETLPTLLFGFAAGVALDRVALRRALVLADLGRAGAFGLLALAVAADAASLWMVFLVAFVAGTLAVGFDSGFQAWLPSLLPEDTLVGMNSKLQFIRTAAWTLGPPLAAFLATGVGGFGAAFALDAFTFLVSALLVLLLVEQRPRPAPAREPWWGSFRRGLQYLWREPRLRAATLAAMAFNLTFAPMEALLVKLAVERLDISEGLVGWFFAGHALLGAFGVVAAPVLARRVGLGRTFVVGLCFLGVGFFSLNAAAAAIAALSPVASTVAAIFPAGLSVAGVSFANVAFTTMRQQIPPPELLGRVTAASRTLSWALFPLGAVLGGALAEEFGIGAVYNGATLLLVSISAVLLFGPLWRDGGVRVLASTDWLYPVGRRPQPDAARPRPDSDPSEPPETDSGSSR